MNHQKRKIKFVFLLFAAYLPAYSYSQEFNIDQIATNIRNGREYARDFPSNTVTIRHLKSNFLKLESDDPIKINLLIKGLEEANLLLKTGNLTTEQRIRAAEMAGTALRLLLQGWNYAGHLSLLDGLRVSYPNSTRSSFSATPDIQPPSSCLPTTEKAQQTVEITDLCIAKGFFEQGLSLVLNTLASRTLEQEQPRILVFDRQPLDRSRYSDGWFDKARVPQYTHYINYVKNEKGEPVPQVIPILTEGYQIGQMLQKYHQTVQTIAQREWSAASFVFGSQKRNQGTGNQNPDSIALRNQAVNTLYSSTHHAFLANLVFAAQISDQADQTGQFPYLKARFDTVKGNLENSRETIRQIRANLNPVLPVDEITASDDQIRDILNRIHSSFQSANSSYLKALESIEKQYSTSERIEQDNRILEGWASELEQLTGFYFGTGSNQLQTVDANDVRTRVRDIVSKKISDFNRRNAGEEITVDRVRTDSSRTNILDQRIKDLFKAVLKYNHQQIIFYVIEDSIDREKNKYETIRAIIENSSAFVNRKMDEITFLSQFGPVTLSYNQSFGLNSGSSFSVSTSYDPNALTTGRHQREIEHEKVKRELALLGVEHKDRIAQIYAQLSIEASALQILKYEVDSATNDLNKTMGDVDSLLDRINRFKLRSAKLWYNDPSVAAVPTVSEEIANQDQDDLVANLYRFGKMLETLWQEPFTNPVDCSPVHRLDIRYEQFNNLESIFKLGSVQLKDRDVRSSNLLAKLFLEALRDWDSRLRSCRNLITNRLQPVEISLRQDIKGWRDIQKSDQGWEVARDNSRIKKSNIKNFQRWLNENKKSFQSKPDQIGAIQSINRLRLQFPIEPLSFSYHVNNGTLLKANIIPRITNNPWNLRIKNVSFKIEKADSNPVFSINPGDITSVYLAQAGITYNFSASEICRNQNSELCPPPSIKELEKYVRYDASQLNLSGLGHYFMLRSSISGDGDDYRHGIEIENKMWSPYCSEWILEIITDKIPFIRIDQIHDILIKFEYSDGVPPPIEFDPKQIITLPETSN